MANLSPNQIAQLAYQAGFRGSALRMAVAVALAESSGNPNAYNPELGAGTRPGHGSRGLWQIYGTAHPQYDNPQAFNPVINAQAAYAVYKEAGNRFTPWSTFNNGSAYSISQNLNLDIPTGQIQLDVGTALPTSTLASAAPGRTAPSALDTKSGAIGTLQQTQNPLLQVSLLPENIRRGLENADPQFWKKSIALGLFGLILLTIGGLLLIAQLTAPVIGRAAAFAGESAVPVASRVIATRMSKGE